MGDSISAQAQWTVGLDLGDRHSQLCVLDDLGEVVEEGRVATRESALRARFEGGSLMRIVVEAGTHSPWVSRLLSDLGHEVIVANPRKVALISGNESKTDQVDARTLARLGRVDCSLLHPIQHRSAQTLADRAVLRARDVLVRMRTQTINAVRGTLKTAGVRMPSGGSSAAFARRAAAHVPESLEPALGGLLEQIAALTERIRAYDARVEALCTASYPHTERLRQVSGVGPVTALAFVLSLEDAARFTRSRAVGSYLGLRPRRSQSGARDPELRITKAGDPDLRRLLVTSAQYILGPFGPDTDLRRFGERLAARGGKAAKKRAVVAVARKLAVLLHRLWVTGERYEPLRNADRVAAQAAAPQAA